MSNKKFEQQLAALEELRAGGPTAPDALRKALGSRSNYLVAKAAAIVAHLGLNALVPDLLAAFDRFFLDSVKTDQQCWAKTAIARALADLGHDDSPVFIRGLQHVQMEPVWGGQQDTAGPLRGHCALALVACRDVSDMAVLSHLVEALVDADRTVRVEAARAIGRINRPEAALLLRLRALIGDQEPEVTGACVSALLAIEGADGIGFASRFLAAGDRVSEEAALALGEMRHASALELLIETWHKGHDAAFGGVLLTAIAISRQAEGTDFLLRLVEAGSPDAVAALASARLTPEDRARLDAAVNSSGDQRLSAAHQKHFGRSPPK